MAAPPLPYPPSPTDVPDDLTDYPASYKRQQTLLLAGLFLFLVTYVGLLLLFAGVATWCFLTLKTYAVGKIVAGVLCSLAVLYFVRGFFKTRPVDKDLLVEIHEDEHPVLFRFIHQLCDELDAPEPDRVVVSPDVNAALMYRTTLVNLFVEPKKDLLIGLGLVNALNLSEFKSVLAHEFGHFCQATHVSRYAGVVQQVIVDLVEGEDWIDRSLNWCKQQDGVVSAFGYAVGGLLWLFRQPLIWLFKVFTLQRLAVSREQEFHADLVAVKAAGSEAVVLSLMRLRFGNLCLMQTLHDLSQAADHKLYTRDVFYHQARAEGQVRANKKDPTLGERPVYADPLDGERHRVFDPDQEELEHEEIPEMRRTHPPAHELEENAKETYVPAVVDDRSPWVLFSAADDLKERVTYKLYRREFKIPKKAVLADPAKVQEYIDGERAETTYDPRYHGVYDDRPLEPGDLADLDQTIRSAPWADDRIDKVLAKLYDGTQGKHDEYNDLRKDKSALENTPGHLSPKLKRKLKDLETKMDQIRDWFRSFDRRVYLCHVQMAWNLDPAWKDDLVERYRFQQAVQRLYGEAMEHQEKALAYAGALFQADNPPGEFVAEVMQVLRESWRGLKKIIQDARDVNLPAMKNFEEGERLADFILDGKLVAEPPLSYIKGEWVVKLLNQLEGVRRRCFRLHWKSVGGILALQEKVAAAWEQRRAGAAVTAEPVEVLDAIPVEELPVAEVLEVVEVAVAPPPPPPAAPGLPPLGGPLEPVGPTPPPPPAPELELEPVPATAHAVTVAEPPAVQTVAEPRVEERIVLELPPEPARATVTIAAKNGRPPLRITVLRPGEKSPLG